MGFLKSVWIASAVAVGAGGVLAHSPKNPPPILSRLVAIRSLSMEGSGPMVAEYRPRSLTISRYAIEAFFKASRRAPGAPRVSVPRVTFMDYFGPAQLTVATSAGRVIVYPDYSIVKAHGGGYHLVYHQPYLVIQRGRTTTYIKNLAWDHWFITNQWQNSFVRN
jgi:hypothetical protein